MGTIEYKNNIAEFIPGPAWTPAILSAAPISRVSNRSDNDTIVTAISNSGNVNTITLADVSSNISSGTTTNNNNCAFFALPLKDSDGGDLLLSSHFTLNIFLKITATPGVEDNDCFILGGLCDGNTDLDTGRIAGGLVWDNATGPKPTGMSFGGGITKGAANAASQHAQTIVSTNMPSIVYVTCANLTNSISAAGEVIQTRLVTGQHAFEGSASPPSSRRTDPAYLGIFVGRTATGAGSKEFSFEMYYSIVPSALFIGSKTTNPS
jgi:hypothetical protein